MCEAAWAAGFWDGEGYTRIVKNSVQMETAQVHPEVLERLQRVLGGRIYGPYERGGNRQPEWRWALVGFDRVQAAIEVLRPHLSSVKMVQAMTALAAHEVKTIGCMGHPKRAEIVERYAQGATSAELAREYGVHPVSVVKMVRRLRPEAIRPRGGRRPVPNPSIKKEDTYQALKRKGMSKTKAAKISNAQAKKSKKK